MNVAVKWKSGDTKVDLTKVKGSHQTGAATPNMYSVTSGLYFTDQGDHNREGYPT